MTTLGSTVKRWGIAIAALCLASGVMAAPLGELVVYQAEGVACSGLCPPGAGANITATTLSGILYSPKRPGKTGIVLVPHGQGGFIDGLDDYSPLAQRLTDAGYTLLLANMRTATGWTYGRFESSLPDVGAAVGALKARGVQNVILLGTGLGGPRIAYYAWKANDPSIKALVFLSSITSPYLEGRVRLSAEKLAAFDAFLERARKIVSEGHAHYILCFNTTEAAGDGKCDPGGAGTSLSAGAFLSLFGNPKDSDVNLTNYADQIKLPVAVLHGRHDEVSLPAVGQGLYDAFSRASKHDLIWIDDPQVSHTFSPVRAANRYAEEVTKWVVKTVPAR